LFFINRKFGHTEKPGEDEWRNLGDASASQQLPSITCSLDEEQTFPHNPQKVNHNLISNFPLSQP
jgi:hypothetical protein